jgi:hypothetical protein
MEGNEAYFFFHEEIFVFNLQAMQKKRKKRCVCPKHKMQ